MGYTARPAFRALIDAMPGNSNLREQDFVALAPMHPYTAFLLTMLSSSFSASQRTMFSFLRGDQAGGTRENFNWFIQNQDMERSPWLTVDYLWNYFFAVENADASPQTQEIRSYYLNKCDSMDEQELRVFKVIMLLMLLEKEARGNRIYRPLVRNVQIAFIGTPLNGKTDVILESFARKGYINLTGAADDMQITFPMMSIDQARLEEITKRVSLEKSFERCMASGGDIFEATKSLYRSNMPNRFAERFLVRPCSALSSNARATLSDLGRFIAEKPYRIGVLLLLPKEEADIPKINQFIEIEASKEENGRIIFINMAEPIRADQWDAWIKAKAREEYAGVTGDQNRRFYADAAKSILTAWCNKLAVVIKFATFCGEKKQISDNLSAYLDKIVNKVYGYGPEQLSLNDNLYKPQYGNTYIKMGMGLDTGSRGAFDGLIKQIIDDGLWENRDGLSQPKANPLNKAYRALQELIDGNQAQPTRFVHIWDMLQAPPFGYFPSAIASFIVGYLLTGYTKGQHYLDDGRNTVLMSVEGMAKVVEDMLKGKAIALSYKLLKMDPKHLELCQRIASIFGLSEDQTVTLAEACKHMRIKVAQWQYPIWVVEYSKAYEEQDNKENLSQTIGYMIRFMNSTDPGTELVIADKLYDLMSQTHRLHLYLRNLLITDNLLQGMNVFLEKHAPQTVSYIIGSLGKQMSDVREAAKVRTAESGCWLWGRDKFQQEMESWEKETQLVCVLNALLAQQASDLKDAYAQLRGIFGQYRLPFSILRLVTLGNVDALQKLWNVIVRSQREDPSNLAEELKDQITDIRVMIFGEDKLLQAYVFKEFNIDLPLESIRTNLTRELQANAWEKDATVFRSEVERHVQNMKALQLFEQMRSLWRDISGVDSPNAWSDKMGTPIEWIPVYDDPAFKDVIQSLRSQRPGHPNYIAKLIENLQANNILWKNQLVDQSLCDQMIVKHIVPNNRHMIGTYLTVNELRTQMLRIIGRNVSDWPSRLHDLIRESGRMLEQAYQTKAMPSVRRKIEDMTPDRAKAYLMELVKSSAALGMAILEEDK